MSPPLIGKRLGPRQAQVARLIAPALLLLWFVPMASMAFNDMSAPGRIMLSDLVAHRPRYAATISFAILSVNHVGVVVSAQLRHHLALSAPTPPKSAFKHADWQCRLHDAMWPLTVLVLTLPLVTGEAHDWPAWEWQLAWAQHLSHFGLATVLFAIVAASGWVDLLSASEQGRHEWRLWRARCSSGVAHLGDGFWRSVGGLMKLGGVGVIYVTHVVYVAITWQILIDTTPAPHEREWLVLAGEELLLLGMAISPSLGHWRLLGRMDDAEAVVMSDAPGAEGGSSSGVGMDRVPVTARKRSAISPGRRR